MTGTNYLLSRVQSAKDLGIILLQDVAVILQKQVSVVGLQFQIKCNVKDALVAVWFIRR